jgi:hypothetical protein
LELPITEEAATIAVRNYLDGSYHAGDDVEITAAEWDEELILFCYQSKVFLKTQNISDMLLGNGPIMVDTSTGDVIELGTILPVEEYVRGYRELRANDGSRA